MSSVGDISNHIPIIDIGELVANSSKKFDVAEQINSACREYGFFYVTGHGFRKELEDKLENLSRQFFAQSIKVKDEIRMDFVRQKTPLYGSNLFPTNIPGFKETVLEYIDVMTQLGHTIMAGIALSLNLDETYFAEVYTRNPLPLFRIFNYPAGNENPNTWGVGEHTDYGILTILKQDDLGGLQVKSKSCWIEAPPVAGTFVCNIGDMLERMTAGLYKSTPHRVRSPAATSRDRLSFPFFFDPNFHTEVKPIELLLKGDGIVDDSALRWDKSNVHEFHGTYGEYLLKKVSKVFPQLREEVL